MGISRCSVKSPSTQLPLTNESDKTHLNRHCWHFCWHLRWHWNRQFPGSTIDAVIGIAIRLMGVAKPVLLTNGEENSRYPATACLRIEPGLAEEDSLWHNMFLLTSLKECAGDIGLRASGHIVARHQAVRIAEQYWDTLCAYRQ